MLEDERRLKASRTNSNSFSWCFCLLLMFHLFSLLFRMFLSFCYNFLSVFCVFFDFLYSVQLLCRFHVSRVSSILRLLLSILLSCLAILRFCCLFLPIGCMLVSFRYISCRFYTDLMCSFDFTAFWFHFASLLPGSG